MERTKAPPMKWDYSLQLESQRPSSDDELRALCSAVFSACSLQGPQLEREIGQVLHLKESLQLDYAVPGDRREIVQLLLAHPILDSATRKQRPARSLNREGLDN